MLFTVLKHAKLGRKMDYFLPPSRKQPLTITFFFRYCERNQNRQINFLPYPGRDCWFKCKQSDYKHYVKLVVGLLKAAGGGENGLVLLWRIPVSLILALFRH